MPESPTLISAEALSELLTFLPVGRILLCGSLLLLASYIAWWRHVRQSAPLALPLEKGRMYSARSHHGRVHRGRRSTLSALDDGITRARSSGRTYSVLLFQLENHRSFPEDTVVGILTATAGAIDEIGRVSSGCYLVGLEGLDRAETRDELKRYSANLSEGCEGLDLAVALDLSEAAGRTANEMLKAAGKDLTRYLPPVREKSESYLQSFGSTLPVIKKVAATFAILLGR